MNHIERIFAPDMFDCNADYRDEYVLVNDRDGRLFWVDVFEGRQVLCQSISVCDDVKCCKDCPAGEGCEGDYDDMDYTLEEVISIIDNTSKDNLI